MAGRRPPHDSPFLFGGKFGETCFSELEGRIPAAQFSDLGLPGRPRCFFPRRVRSVGVRLARRWPADSLLHVPLSPFGPLEGALLADAFAGPREVGPRRSPATEESRAYDVLIRPPGDPVGGASSFFPGVGEVVGDRFDVLSALRVPLVFSRPLPIRAIGFRAPPFAPPPSSHQQHATDDVRSLLEKGACEQVPDCPPAFSFSPAFVIPERSGLLCLILTSNRVNRLVPSVLFRRDTPWLP